jgi:hypothetical protein
MSSDAPTITEHTEQENQFEFFWWMIPNTLFRNPNISYFECFLFALIRALDGKDGCYANNAYLAEKLRVSELQVMRGIKTLLEQGFITKQVSADKRTRLLSVSDDFAYYPKKQLSKMIVSTIKNVTHI